VAETVPGYVAVSWAAVLTPRGVPGSIVTRWNGEINRILQLPDVKERMAADGLEIVGGSPGRFRDMLGRDVAKWQSVVKAANIKLGG
jgi:tripartite-type tricarboxylate transporter receptor subunit TctC